MFAHSEITKQLEELVKAAEEMEASNKAAAQHGMGSSIVDHLVALTRVVQKIHKMQKTGF